MSVSARKRYTLPLYTWLLYSRLPYTYLFLYLIPTSFSTSFDNIPCLFLPERDTLDSCIPGSVTSVFLYLIYISFSTSFDSHPMHISAERDTLQKEIHFTPVYFTVYSLTHIPVFPSFISLSPPHLTPLPCLCQK